MSIVKYKNEFLLSLKYAGRTESTVKRYSFDLNDFFLWCEVQTEIVEQFVVSEEAIVEYFRYLDAEKAYSLASRKRIRTVLNQYFKFLYRKKYITNKPITFKLPEKGWQTYSPRDFVKEFEMKQLIHSVNSFHGLSEKQIPAHQFLKFRNQTILMLFFQYGLTLKEVTNLQIDCVDFYQNKLYLEAALPRTLELSVDDKKLMYQYYESIPKAVRPRVNSDDPFFVAFDFARNTYRWDYTDNKPKQLTEIAIQKMIRTELARAGIRDDISAQHLRRTAILNALKCGLNYEEINVRFGFRANNSLSRYISYLENEQEQEKTQAT